MGKFFYLFWAQNYKKILIYANIFVSLQRF